MKEAHLRRLRPIYYKYLENDRMIRYNYSKREEGGRMKKLGIFLTVLLFVTTLIVSGYAATEDLDKNLETAQANFKQARTAYITAKQTLSDAQIKSIRTIGRAEKDEAVKAVWDARKEVKKTKEAYKAALSALRKAEIAKSATIDRSPWR